MGWLDLLIFLFHPNQHEKGRQIIQNFWSHIDPTSCGRSWLSRFHHGVVWQRKWGQADTAGESQTNKQTKTRTSRRSRWVNHRESQTNKQTRTSGHSRRAIFNVFYLLYKTVSLNKAKTFRCCPLRCRVRLLRRLRCSTTRTTKLSTLERSVSVFTQSWQILNKRV